MDLRKLSKSEGLLLLVGKKIVSIENKLKNINIFKEVWTTTQVFCSCLKLILTVRYQLNFKTKHLLICYISCLIIVSVISN